MSNNYWKDFEYEGGYLRVMVSTKWDQKDYPDPVREVSFNDGYRRVYFTASLAELTNLGNWLKNVAEFEVRRRSTPCTNITPVRSAGMSTPYRKMIPTTWWLTLLRLNELRRTSIVTKPIRCTDLSVSTSDP